VKILIVTTLTIDFRLKGTWSNQELTGETLGNETLNHFDITSTWTLLRTKFKSYKPLKIKVMSKEEAKTILIESIWYAGAIKYKFTNDGLSINNNPYRYSIKEENGKLILADTGIKNNDDLLLTINDKVSPKTVTISSTLEGDPGFTKIVLVEKQ